MVASLLFLCLTAARPLLFVYFQKRDAFLTSMLSPLPQTSNRLVWRRKELTSSLSFPKKTSLRTYLAATAKDDTYTVQLS